MPRGRFRFRKAISGSAALRVPRTWTPRLIGSSLLAWYDASDVGSFFFGTGVSQWRDISGNGLHLDQSIAANQPIRNATGLNGLPTVAFDGSNDALFSDPTNPLYPWPLPQGQPFTIVQMVQPPPYASLVSNQRFWSGFTRTLNTSNDVWTFGYIQSFTAGAVANYANYGGSVFGSTTIYAAGGTPTYSPNALLMLSVFNGTGNSLTRIYGSPMSVANSSTSLYGLTLGCERSPSFTLHSAVKFSEFMVVTGAPNTALMQRIEGYLAWKWGVQGSLVAGHPYLNTPPTA